MYLTASIENMSISKTASNTTQRSNESNIVYPLNFKFPGQIFNSKTIKTHPNNEKFNINVFSEPMFIERNEPLFTFYPSLNIIITHITHFSFHFFFFTSSSAHPQQYYYIDTDIYLPSLITHQPHIHIYTIYYFPFIIIFFFLCACT